MLVIEHDMNLISGLADRIVALDRGVVVAEGKPLAVLGHAAVVESYLGPAAVRRTKTRPRRRRRAGATA